MIYKFICAGNDTFSKCYKKEDNEFIIAIDGGLNILVKQNIKPNLVIGDFDSVSDIDINLYQYIKYPTKKDKSDFEYGLEYILYEKDFNIENDSVIVYNATGGRLDHYQTVINLLIKYDDYNIKVYDDLNYIYISQPKMVLQKNEYKYISFFSYKEETFITLVGFSYPLNNYPLSLRDNICLSNEIIEEGFVATNNKVLVIHSK